MTRFSRKFALVNEAIDGRGAAADLTTAAVLIAVAWRAAAVAAVFVFVLMMVASSPASVTWARSAPQSFADLAERLSPAVVNISTKQNAPARRGRSEVPAPQFPPGSPFEDFFKEFFDRPRGGGDNAPARPTRRITSLGSGFIVDASGLVVTNNHVIAEADEITVILSDNTELPATIIGRDTKTDLAVLRVKADKPLPAVAFGDSDVARVGDWVLAIGNPYGLGGTVTAGIISARGRNINAGPYDDFLQTDAPINRGNSGGPMFNLEGEVIGINTAIFSPSGGSVGIGFAIPSALARPVFEQLVEYGRTRRGWLGVRIQTVTDEIAESLGLDEARGALVAGVREGGPAETAGITAGDIVLSFDNQSVTEMRKLPRIVADTKIGQPVDVGIWRKGKKMTVRVTIGELEESGQQTASVDPKAPRQSIEKLVALGMTLAQLTDQLKQRYEIGDDVKGVVVTGVRQGSPASEKGINSGDVILEVNQDEVLVPANVVQKIREARASDRRSVLLRVYRRDTFLYVVVRLEDS